MLQLIKPWWLRLLVLIGIGFPLLTNHTAIFISTKLSLFLHPELASVMAYPLITLLIWLICLFNLGHTKFLNYMSAAFAMALTTVITSAFLRHLLPSLFMGNGPETSVRHIKLYFNILAVFPWSMTFINAFSANSLMEQCVNARRPFKDIGLHLALSLRVFQHVSTVVSRLLIIWQERHPEVLIPRHTQSWSGLKGIFYWLKWFYHSIIDWVFACIILTFEPIPVMVNEFEIIAESNTNESK